MYSTQADQGVNGNRLSDERKGRGSISEGEKVILD